MDFIEKEEKFKNIYYNEIGMCGCGSPNEVKNLFYSLLENHRSFKDEEISYELMSKNRENIIKSVNSDVIFEVIFHLFENSGILEHGSSVYSSWFTDEGFIFLKLLKEFKDEI